MSRFRLEKLTEANFKDFESLTSCENGGGCYCAFWHQKITSMDEWHRMKSERPLENRDAVAMRVRNGFHVGVLAYEGDTLAAWISVGPLPDFYWAWRRVGQMGDSAKETAGIVCITLSPSVRGQGRQTELLNALIEYGRTQGWKAIEGYPFDALAFEKHGKAVSWPGHTKGFEAAGFARAGEHWLNHPEWPRSVYRYGIGPVEGSRA